MKHILKSKGLRQSLEARNMHKWNKKIGCYNCGMVIGIQAFYNVTNVFGNVMIVEDRLNKIMMHFTEGISKVNKGDDKGTFFDFRLINNICHLSRVFQSASQIGSKSLLNVMFNEIISFRKENIELRRHEVDTFNGTVSRVIGRKLEGSFVSNN